MGEAMLDDARFPGWKAGDGGYESYYVKASHPTDPVSIWLRHTVHKRPGHAPLGSLWLTLFDATGAGPWAVKETTVALDAGGGDLIRVGDARFAPGVAVGRAAAVPAAAERREASWELTFTCPEAPLRHLPRAWMYRAPLPRTKLLSPYPDARFEGTVVAGGREVDITGWRGMVGHNWGAQHAERWIWMHGAGFEGDGGAWIDVALGRIKVGGWTTPWVANGVLALGGERLRLGGLGATRTTEVAERADGAAFTLTGRDVTVQGQVGAEPGDFVGWVYADPDGSEHNVVNCSIANMVLTVSRPGRAPATLTLAGSAAYELGMRETDHGVPLQPFGDG
ncbi:MAG: hypothetical protein GXY03_16200 [Solirubrobacterales bacterium]|nr:hypothetical protein [Solirubrobacterales bacterium]